MGNTSSQLAPSDQSQHQLRQRDDPATSHALFSPLPIASSHEPAGTTTLLTPPASSLLPEKEADHDRRAAQQNLPVESSQCLDSVTATMSTHTAEEKAAKAARKQARAEKRARKEARRARRELANSQLNAEDADDTVEMGQDVQEPIHSHPTISGTPARQTSIGDDDEPGTQLRSEAMRAQARSALEELRPGLHSPREFTDVNPKRSKKRARPMEDYEEEKQVACEPDRKKRKRLNGKQPAVEQAAENSIVTPGKSAKVPATILTAQGSPSFGSWIKTSEAGPSLSKEKAKIRSRKSAGSSGKAIKASIGQRKGAFDDEEAKIVKKYVKEYRKEHKLSDGDFRAFLQPDGGREKSGILTFFADLHDQLLGRDRRSIRRYVQRKYSATHRGQWTKEEDEQLREAYERKPHAWVHIGGQLGRMPEDCRDRWRNHIGLPERQTGAWNDLQDIELEQAIDTCKQRLRDEEFAGRSMSDAELESYINWSTVSQLMDGKRSRLQCSARWRRLQTGEGEVDESVQDTAGLSRGKPSNNAKSAKTEPGRLGSSSKKLLRTPAKKKYRSAERVAPEDDKSDSASNRGEDQVDESGVTDVERPLSMSDDTEIYNLPQSPLPDRPSNKSNKATTISTAQSRSDSAMGTRKRSSIARSSTGSVHPTTAVTTPLPRLDPPGGLVLVTEETLFRDESSDDDGIIFIDPRDTPALPRGRRLSEPEHELHYISDEEHEIQDEDEATGSITEEATDTGRNGMSAGSLVAFSDEEAVGPHKTFDEALIVPHNFGTMRPYHEASFDSSDAGSVDQINEDLADPLSSDADTSVGSAPAASEIEQGAASPELGSLEWGSPSIWAAPPAAPRTSSSRKRQVTYSRRSRRARSMSSSADEIEGTPVIAESITKPTSGSSRPSFRAHLARQHEDDDPISEGDSDGMMNRGDQRRRRVEEQSPAVRAVQSRAITTRRYLI